MQTSAIERDRPFIKRPLVHLLGMALLSAVSAVTGADLSPQLQQAQRLLAAGEPQQALELLRREWLTQAGDPDFDYLLGVALEQSGHTDEALFAYERVVIVNPNHTDARLKMGAIYAQRSHALAGRELAQQPLQGEGGRSGRSLQGYLLTGLGWDSNITSGPKAKQLPLPDRIQRGVEVMTDLGSASQAEDSVMLLEAGVTLNQPISDQIGWVGSGSLRQNLYPTHHANQEGIVNFDLGVRLGQEGNRLGISMISQIYLLDDQRYRQALGGHLSWSYTLGNGTPITSYLQYVDFNYTKPENRIDNSVRQVVGFASEWAWADRSGVIQYGLYGGEDRASDSPLATSSYRLWGFHLGGSLPLRERFTLALGLLYEPHHYRVEDLLYLRGREDQIYTLGLSLDYSLSPDLHLIPLLTYTRNDSTLELYDYRRSSALLQIKWEFSR